MQGVAVAPVARVLLCALQITPKFETHSSKFGQTVALKV